MADQNPIDAAPAHDAPMQTGRPVTRSDTPTPTAASPARWAAAGVLGGASVVGMLWAILGRAPAPLPTLERAPRPVPSLVPSPVPALVEAQPIDQRPKTSDPDSTPPSVQSRNTSESDPVPVGHETTPQAQEACASNTPMKLAERESPEATRPAADDETPQQLIQRLDINTATQAELELLPGIGPTLASRIIAFRDSDGPIRSLTHLTDVKGIGVRTAEKIEPYIRFD